VAKIKVWAVQVVKGSGCVSKNPDDLQEFAGF